MELLRDEVHCLSLEWCGISLVSVQTGNLTEYTLDQVTNGHTRWDSVWINNHVRNHSFNGKWKIFLPVCHTTGTFLSVTTGKFISNLRNLNCPYFDLHKTIHLLICCDDDLVNDSFLRVLERNTPIFELL